MHKSCTVYRTADFIGKKWTLLILLELYKGKTKWKRYSTIKRKLQDITPKMLSARLSELIQEGIVLRRVGRGQFPIKCEYRLSKSGEDFIPIIKGMKRWALRWKIKSKPCENGDCRTCEL